MIYSLKKFNLILTVLILFFLSSESFSLTCTPNSPHSINCHITNSTGKQVQTCNSNGKLWGAYGACSNINCDNNHILVSGKCEKIVCVANSVERTSCTNFNGVDAGYKTRTCNATGTNISPYGPCGIVKCKSGYRSNGLLCIKTAGAITSGSTGASTSAATTPPNSGLMAVSMQTAQAIMTGSFKNISSTLPATTVPNGSLLSTAAASQLTQGVGQAVTPTVNTVTTPSSYKLTVSTGGENASDGYVGSSLGDEIGCGHAIGALYSTNCSANFTAKTIVKLVANSASSTTRFKGWSGACLGGAYVDCIITMDGPKNVIAIFEPVPSGYVHDSLVLTTTINNTSIILGSQPTGSISKLISVAGGVPPYIYEFKGISSLNATWEGGMLNNPFYKTANPSVNLKLGTAAVLQPTQVTVSVKDNTNNPGVSFTFTYEVHDPNR